MLVSSLRTYSLSQFCFENSAVSCPGCCDLQLVLGASVNGFPCDLSCVFMGVCIVSLVSKVGAHMEWSRRGGAASHAGWSWGCETQARCWQRVAWSLGAVGAGRVLPERSGAEVLAAPQPAVPIQVAPVGATKP